MVLPVGSVVTGGNSYGCIRMAEGATPPANLEDAMSDNNKNILGYNSNNNQFDSSAVVANKDGSVVERLEDIVTKVEALETALPAVPAQEATLTAVKAKTDNLPSDPADQSMIDAKLGATNDFASNQTLLGYQNSLYQHVHNQAKGYPTLADGVIVTGGAGAWVLGNFAEIIPASTITTAFDIHYINFEGASATDTYEFVLYKGALGAEIEIGRIRTDRESAQSGVTNVPIQIPAQDANTRISAKK